MEFFLPSLVLMLSAFFISYFVVPSFTPVIIAIMAMVCLVFAVYNHYTTFPEEYNIMQWADAGKQIAPTLLTGLIIVLMGGYIIYLSTMGQLPSLSMPPSWIPSPSTATNPMTRAIGEGLIHSNAVNVRSAGSLNSRYRNQAEDLLEQGQ